MYMYIHTYIHTVYMQVYAHELRKMGCMGKCTEVTCIYTCLHLLKSPASTLRASITIKPAITALVVAIAGMILPAMAAW